VKRLVFLKLGGSLITDKNVAHLAKIELIRRLAGEIQAVVQADPELHLLIGHGSGSFGHVPASRYHTREGVHSAGEWKGFAEVWHAARVLNQVVTEQCVAAGLPVISLPPSASVTASDGKVHQWDITPIRGALEHGLIPIIQGDVVFDIARGGTIFSTEELFVHLAGFLHPVLILIAGSEPGVWADFPGKTRLLAHITPSGYADIAKMVFPSGAVDVTGGMAAKVAAMVSLVSAQPELRVMIFNPSAPGVLASAISGETTGTEIHI